MVKIIKHVWGANEVWAAAAYATRINGGYYKNTVFSKYEKVDKLSNKELILSALEDTTQIPEQDYETGKLASKFISQRCMLRKLKNKMTDFDRSMARICAMEDFTLQDRYEIAMVGSQIQSYLNGVKEIHILEEADRSAGYLGKVGERFEFQVTIHKTVWSEKYGLYFYTGITSTKQPVIFSNKKRIAENIETTVKGTVKLHRDQFTHFNRVKIV